MAPSARRAMVYGSLDSTGSRAAIRASSRRTPRQARARQAAEWVVALRTNVQELREVLSAVAARVRGPSASLGCPHAYAGTAEVLTGWIGLLDGVLGAIVLQRNTDVGAVTLPAWWPIG